MKVVLQRVTEASVHVEGDQIAKINEGFLLLWGVEKGDREEDSIALSNKISNLRIFSDKENKMNLSILNINGKVLIVSQFTLNANISNGNRPSFINSEDPLIAERLIEVAVRNFLKKGILVETGQFGSTMDVKLHNNGPVTLILNSKDSHVS